MRDAGNRGRDWPFDNFGCAVTNPPRHPEPNRFRSHLLLPCAMQGETARCGRAKGATMPREQINTPARRTITVPTGANGLSKGEVGIHFTRDGEGLHEGQHWEDTPTLFVGWDRPADHGLPTEDGCIQFHMTVAADEILRAADEITCAREHPDLPGLDRFTFSTVALSRVETQKSIRVIRRARDAAFGADE